MSDKNTIVHWFRKGLRIHDNPSLIQATKLIYESPDKLEFRPIFILDPGIIKWLKVGSNRWRFLQESLQQLNNNLKSINSRLYVIRGNPKEMFPKLFKQWHVTVLTFEADTEPYSLERDKLIESQAKKYHVKVIQEFSHTIYNPYLILKQNAGKPIVTYQKFLSIASKIPITEPLDVPQSLPKSSMPKPDNEEQGNNSCYNVPTLSELNVNKKSLGSSLYPGGETEGLQRLEKYLNDIKWVCSFEKPNTSPNSLEPSTTVLSPYLKFGCVSSRLFYKKLKGILNQNKKHSQPPVSLEGQLMWREFYYAAATGVTNFDKMVGNSICLQVPWDTNKTYLEAWTHGKTGYPFIDAIMRQLRQEGWIHHLARHAVACFLTRGDLWISWEEGQKVFEELLLDADWALNAGNWMWLSASAFFHQYFRVYSPVAFGKKTDPDGKYIKKYVPELKKYPSSIIYEPWKASLDSQRNYGCIIGKDYPQRIVIHEEISKINISRMAEAYKANKNKKLAVKEKLQATGSADDKRKAESTLNKLSKKFKTSNSSKTNLRNYLNKK